MRRGYAILAVFQLLVIYILQPMQLYVLKAHGYPDDPTKSWSLLTVALSEYGLLLPVLPVIWFGVFMILRTQNQSPLINRTAWATGIGLFVLLFGLFLYGVLDPFTRKILLAPA